jgi:hypothetical protein
MTAHVGILVRCHGASMRQAHVDAQGHVQQRKMAITPPEVTNFRNGCSHLQLVIAFYYKTGGSSKKYAGSVDVICLTSKFFQIKNSNSQES